MLWIKCHFVCLILATRLDFKFVAEFTAMLCVWWLKPCFGSISVCIIKCKFFFVHSDLEQRNRLLHGRSTVYLLQKSKPMRWSLQSCWASQGRSLQQAGVCIKEKRFTAHSALMELRIFNQANSICCGKRLPVFEAGPITGWFDEARPQRDMQKRGNSERLAEA